MATLLIGLLAALMLLFAIAFRGKLFGAAARYVLFGLVAGFLLGIVAGVSMGVLYRFTAMRIPDPVFIFAGYATTMSSLLPFLFGAAGMTVGAMAAFLRRKSEC